MATIIALIAALLPIAEKAGVDIYRIIEGLRAGKTVDELIAEAESKRNDLPDLGFKPE